MKTLVLGQQRLSLEDVWSVSQGKLLVEISKQAKARIERAHDFLKSQIGKGQALYGINTGFGNFSQVSIPSGELEHLQYNLLRSHACGMGPSMSDEVVKAMLLLRASNLCLGHSGVSVGLVEQILSVLNAGIIPIVPEQGSVGASGDLAPLAHLALPLIGEGRAKYGGKIVSGAIALEQAGLAPIRLGPKEGLALINGTQFMTAIGTLNLLKAERLCELADLSGAMSVEAMRGTLNPFDAHIHSVRPHPGQVKTAENLRGLLAPGGKSSEINGSHKDCKKVQDPYSLRCMPQVHGASRDALAFVRQVLEREVNSVTDNPLIFPDASQILSGGNFHGQIVAIAMDVLAIAAAEIGSISEQRFAKLINPVMSDLPAFLTAHGGLNSGFMILHVAAASLVSENKTLCHPACVDSIPTSADKEDHVSMGAWGARKAGKVVENTERILSLEFLAAAQGIDLLRPLKSTPPIEKAHEKIRSQIPRWDQDRIAYEDVEKMIDLCKEL